MRRLIGAMGAAGLLLCGLVHAQPAPGPGPILLAPGARCGFVGDCSRFEQIGLHVGAGAAVRTDSARSVVDAQGTVRLSLTAGGLAEGGAALAGHVVRDGDGNHSFIASPVSLFMRVRLLPLPLGPLAAAPLRLSLSYQHDLVAEPFGQDEPPGFSRGTLRVVAGGSAGPVDVDGSVGFVLVRPDDRQPRLHAFELGAAASLWLWRAGPEVRGEELRLTAEALYRFAVEPGSRGEGNLLLGVLGTTATGYGGGVAVGMQVADSQPGFVAVSRFQISWGKRHHNPWAEHKAAEPQTTPAFIWKLLGAIDPIVGSDGCIWTDPTPERPSTRWFCIGKADPNNPSLIIVKDGKSVAVGTHLWELGKSLWVDDGSRVVQIPLLARFRRAVWDYVDQQARESKENREKYRRQVCEGKVSILHGADAGTASMLAHDEFGGAAALLGEELLRAIYCGEEESAEEQTLGTLGLLGALRSHGPWRARVPANRRLGDGAEQEAGKRGGGGGATGGVAEHTVPPQTPSALTASARQHIYAGDVKKGKSTGWHYEPTGDAAQGTYVLESTRSAPDVHGVYEANVVIQGVKKGPRSSFFPAHWTQEEIEKAIDEAYRNKVPNPDWPGVYQGVSTRGVRIELRLWGDGSIQTTYPIYERNT